MVILDGVITNITITLTPMHIDDLQELRESSVHNHRVIVLAHKSKTRE